MQVITFYSYKGGVGRTLACANFGLYLAKMGQKVVLLDMDFEAPGLDSKFQLDVQQLDGGLLKQFSAFQQQQPLPDLHALDIELTDDVTKSGGSLKLIPAGNHFSPNYYRELSGLQWDCFLKTEEGLSFCLDLVKRIQHQYHADYIVIDSRTGLTEIGGLCTQILPDTVLLFSCTSPESLMGTKKIYEKIINSSIIKNRKNNQIEIKIILTRIPRPEKLEQYDKLIKSKLDLGIDRLFYLFDQSDMSLEEYLALNRFEENCPAILNDYVELFSSLNPDATVPYIQKRIENFSNNLTKRQPQENEKLIQELLTLFPHPEVFLEAARYYRISKGDEIHIISNYSKYLDIRPQDVEVLGEFAKVCEDVPLQVLHSIKNTASHLERFGLEKMNVSLLNIYMQLNKHDELQLRKILDVIEASSKKINYAEYRTIYIKVLSLLKEWKKLLETAAKHEISSRQFGLTFAKAHAELGNKDECLSILENYEMRNPEEIGEILYLLYKVKPEADLNYIENEIFSDYNNSPFRKMGLGIERIIKSIIRFNENSVFVEWLQGIINSISIR